MKKQPKWFWVARDVEGRILTYCVNNKKMLLERGAFKGYSSCFCIAEFQGLTGIRLKPGEQAQFKLVRRK